MAMADLGIGRIWTLYFTAPLGFILFFIDIDYSNLVGEELYWFIFIIVLSLCWLVGLYFVVKRVKKVINNK